MHKIAYAGRIRALGAKLRKKNERKRARTDKSAGAGVTLPDCALNKDFHRINKLTTTDKALYRFYVASKSILPIYLRELS